MWVTLPKSRTLGILYAVVQQRGPGGAWFLKWCEKESCYFSAQKKKSDRSEGFCAYRQRRFGVATQLPIDEIYVAIQIIHWDGGGVVRLQAAPLGVPIILSGRQKVTATCRQQDSKYLDSTW